MREILECFLTDAPIREEYLVAARREISNLEGRLSQAKDAVAKALAARAASDARVRREARSRTSARRPRAAGGSSSHGWPSWAGTLVAMATNPRTLTARCAATAGAL